MKTLIPRVTAPRKTLFLCAMLAAWLPLSQAEPTTYQGIATPIISATIKFGYNDAFRGIIDYVARPGEILRGAIYDKDGKIVEPADILIHMETDYRESAVAGKKAVLKSTEANLKIAAANYERYAKLIKTDATSIQIFQQSEADYYAAIGNKEAAEADLKLAEVMLRACTFSAPFDAIVDKVFFPAGLCSGELDIVRISQLTPMGIHVKMNRSTAMKITADTPISVYTANSSTPVGVLNGFSYLTDDGIMLKVDNLPMPPPVKLEENGKTIPVCDYSVILPHATREAQKPIWLSVPSDGIFKDAQGSYVWLGEGQRNMQPGKGLDTIFAVKKTYISPANYQLTIDANIKCQLIRNGEKLQAYDLILVGNIPATLRDNDRVCSYRQRYQFMPGDPVSVKIGK